MSTAGSPRSGRRATPVRSARAAASLVVSWLWFACEGDENTSVETTEVREREVAENSGGDTATSDAPVDADSAGDSTSDLPDTPSDTPSDTFVEELTRPELGADSEGPLDGVAEDAPPGETEAPTVVEGDAGCLHWTLELSATSFDWKEDDVLVVYEVETTCSDTMTFRVEHLSDFFPLAIHADGALWTYVGQCPGEGGSMDWRFDVSSRGVRRAWVWRAADHESLMTRCGVSYEPAATFTVVGYGNLPLDGAGAEFYSETYQLTDPVEIRLRP